eukprot:5434196-Amphidinium_carterae.1
MHVVASRTCYEHSLEPSEKEAAPTVCDHADRLGSANILESKDPHVNYSREWKVPRSSLLFQTKREGQYDLHLQCFSTARGMVLRIFLSFRLHSVR